MRPGICTKMFRTDLFKKIDYTLERRLVMGEDLLLEVIYKIDDSLLSYLNKIGRIKILVEKRIGFIIFVPFFSYYILNKQIYRHHLLALIITAA